MKSVVRWLSSIAVLATALLSAAWPTIAFGSQSGVTYHGRILNPDGSPLSGKSVQFKIQIRSPGAESCILYEETQTKDMRGSSGIFSITINDGSGQRTDSGPYNIEEIFANRKPFILTPSLCTLNSSYTPNGSDGRVLAVSFRSENMANWESAPAQSVNFVPMAISAKTVAGYGAENFLRFDDTAAATNTTPLNLQELTDLKALIAGTSNKFMKVSDGNGTAALPVLGSPPSSTPAPGSVWFEGGSIKYSDGTNTFTVGAGGTSGTVSAITVGSGLVDGSGASGTVITSTGTIALPNVGSVGTYYKVTTDSQGRVSSGAAALVEGDIPTLTTAGKVSGDAITSGTIGGSTAINTTGSLVAAAVSATTTSTNNLQVFKTGNGFKVTITAPAGLAADYGLVLPATLPGSSGQVLASDTSGNLSWVTPSGGSVTSVGVTAPVQNTGTASAPVIAMPAANGTTNGYLSSGDWTTFNSKLGSGLASGNLWVGNAGGTATAVAPGGDVAMTNAGVFTVNAIKGTSVSAVPTLAGQVLRYDGTNYTPGFVAMTDLRSTVTGTNQFAASCAANQTLVYNSVGDVMTCANIAISGAQVTYASQTANTVFAAPDGSAGAPSFRALVAGDIPAHDAGKITSGTLPITRGGTGSSDGSITGSGALTFSAGGTNQNVTLTPSGSGATVLGGNVGIGTTTPGVALDMGARTDAILLPKGTTAQQPGSAAAGMFRYNTSNNLLEFHNGTAWTSLSTGSGITALTGDVTASGSGSVAATVVQVNGVAYPAGPSINTVPVVTGANTVTYQAVPVAAGGTGLTSLASNSLLYGNGTGNMNALAPVNSAVLTSTAGGVPQWSLLSADTFTQYALLAGRASGQTLNGGTAASENLTLDSTAHATKGNILMATGGGNVGIGTTTPGARLEVSSGVANTSGLKFTNFTSAAPTTAGQPVGVDASGNLVTVSVSGSGTVNAGTQNQLAYYGANGTAVSGLATANNGVLITDASGVPSIGTTLPNSVQANITALGTVTTGVWNGTAIGAQYGGTGLNASAAANGQLLIGNGAGFTLAGLTGTANQISVATGAGSITLSAPQDIHSGASPTFTGMTLSGMSSAGIVKNSAAGVLSGGNTVALGSEVSGTLPATSGGTGTGTYATGDILYASAANTLSKLAAGTDGKVLTLASGVPSWQSPSGGGSLSGLTAATATNTIDNLNFAQTWNWSTATTQTPLAMNANALTTGSMLSLATSNNSLNSTNGLLNVANTGTSTNGMVASIQANSTAGSGLYVLANGNVGIGTASPLGTLSVPLAPTATSQFGLVSLGDGGWNNGAGDFAGPAAGTYLAVNAAPAFAGHLLELEVGGQQKLAVDSTGWLYAMGGLYSDHDIQNRKWDATAISTTNNLISQGSAIGFNYVFDPTSVSVTGAGYATMQPHHFQVFTNTAQDVSKVALEGLSVHAISSATGGPLDVLKGAGIELTSTTAVNKAYGVFVDFPSATVTDGYGIYINSVVGSSNSYGIYSAGGSKNYFAGNVGIGTTTPGRLLHVAGPMRLTPAALPGTPAAGDIAVDSGAANALKYYDGTQWVTAGAGGGSGTVNSGTQNQLAYYGANGTAVSGLATANNGVLVTSAGGVPSIGTTLPNSVQTNITALGTVTTGVWNGTAIGAQYGGTGLNASAAANGQLLIGNGAGFTLAGLTGTANQISVATGAGSITLSAPQDIHSGASPTFTGMTLSGMSSAGIVKNSAAGVLSGGNTVALGSEVSGTLPAASGGTGTGTYATGDILYASAPNTLSKLAAGTDGKVLTLASGVPSWQSPSGGGALSSLTAAGATNTIDNLNFAQTWNWSTATTQTPLTMNANALTTGSMLSLATSNNSLNSNSGLLNVANNGTSTNGMVASIQANSTAGSGLYVLANGSVGIGTSAPGAELDVNGSLKAISLDSNDAPLTMNSASKGIAWKGIRSPGKITLTNGSSAITGTGTSFIGDSGNSTLDYWWSFSIDGQMYYINNITSETVAVLGNTADLGATSANWTGPTMTVDLYVGGASANGSYSTAIGYSTSTGLYSTAMGSSKATNDYAFSVGGGATASGPHSIAMGSGATASYDLATAIGVSTNASAMAATAIGNGAIASGTVSTSIGYQTTASGLSATAIGRQTTASGNFSTAMGISTTAASRSETTIGEFNLLLGGDALNWIATDPLFVIANGTGAGSRSNAMTVLKNGNVGIGITNPARVLHTSGPMRLTPAALPGTPAAGDIAVDSGAANALKYYDGTQWVTAGAGGGSGTVNSGTQNQLAYYGANGTAVSGLATANNGVLVTSAGGVPSIGTTLPNSVQTNITALGTVTAGVWNGTAIGIANGGTGQTTAAAGFNALSPMTTLGDILYGGAAGAGTRLAGNTSTTKQFLTQTGDGANSAAPAWGALVAGDIPNLDAAKITSGTLPAANGGTGTGTYATGDLLYASAPNTLSKLAAGTDGKVLTLASGVPSWQSPSGGGSLSGLTAATATNTIDNLNFAQVWNWSTASTQTPLAMNANALTTGSMLSLATSNNSLNSTSGLLNVANTGTSTNGMVASIKANSTAGSGLYVLANGNVGIGTSTPSFALELSGKGTAAVFNATAPPVGYSSGIEAYGYNSSDDSYGAMLGASTTSGNAYGASISSGTTTSGDAYGLQVTSQTSGSGRPFALQASASGHLAYGIQLDVDPGASTSGWVTGASFQVNDSATVDAVALKLSGGTNNASSVGLSIAGYTNGYSIYSPSTGRTFFAGNVGVGTKAPAGKFSVSPLQYSTGTASQAASTVTGVGTTWTAAMLGSQFVFFNGTSAGTITAVNSATSLTVSTSQTVASQEYTINYLGLHVDTTGNVGIGTTAPGRLLHVEGPMRLTPAALPGTPAAGDIAVDSGAANALKYYDGTQWVTAGGGGGGSGTVNSGTQNQLAYYGANGTAVSGLTTANNGVLVTSAGGVPSIGTTLPNSVQTNITALGTVTSGVWNGTAIGAQYGGTGLNASAAANGQLLIGNGAGFTLAGLTGTANQISVATGAGSITLSAPQDIHSGASPTFTGMTLSGMSSVGIVKNSAAGVLTGGNTVALGSEVSGTLPATSGGTGISTYATGDLVYASAANTLAKLPASTDGKVLALSGGVPTWVATSSMPPLSAMTAAQASHSIDNGAYTQYWDWNALTTGSGMTMSTNSLTTGNLLRLTNSNNSASSVGNILKVVASGAANNSVPVMITSTGGGNILRINDDGDDADATPFIVDASGNVGIGTTVATEKLEVAGNVRMSGRLAGGVSVNAGSLGSITADFATVNTVRTSGTAEACGTLNITNTTPGGYFTLTMSNATTTCTTILWNGGSGNVKLPAGYGAGATVDGVVYTFLDDGARLWVSMVGF